MGLSAFTLVELKLLYLWYWMWIMSFTAWFLQPQGQRATTAWQLRHRQFVCVWLRGNREHFVKLERCCKNAVNLPFPSNFCDSWILTRPLVFLLSLSLSLSGMVPVSSVYGTGRHFTTMEQGKYREVGIWYSWKSICPWLYTIYFQCVSEKREAFHFVCWFLWSGYYPPDQSIYLL